jgi:2-iminoacetate synthase
MEQVLQAAAAYNPAEYTAEDVCRALDRETCSTEDFAALLSPAAGRFLEKLAQKARQETRRRFGNAVSLFTPLYVSNYCDNSCVYCGFNSSHQVRRMRLDSDAVLRELESIAESGLEEILILTGESRAQSDVRYIGDVCAMTRKYFRVVGIEVYPMNSDEYAYLHQQGADFVTVFQETYDPERYAAVHPAGRKRVFSYRFNAQERALKGGIRGVGFAALLGLADFRRDAFATGLHARLIQRRYPHGEISFSCPRLRPIANQCRVESTPITEAELLQAICAYRLLMPFANITISSRENARFRDHAVGIAATKISAGVDVGIGGHSGLPRGDRQFEIDDGRSVSKIHETLLAQGLQPVMSDYIYV